MLGDILDATDGMLAGKQRWRAQRQAPQRQKRLLRLASQLSGMLRAADAPSFPLVL